MEEIQIDDQWKQTILYSIESDKSAQYEADKIIFHSDNLKKIHHLFQFKQKSKTFGIYGDGQSIETKINELYPEKKIRYQPQFYNDEKGKIIAVYDEQIIILSLLISKKMLITKPLNDKSMEITLVRILQDLTQTIFVCLSDEVLTNWYVGDNIPFHDQQITQLQQFKIEQSQQENITAHLTKLEALIPDSFNGWQILKNKNNCPYILLFRKNEISTQEINEFNYALNNLMMEIIADLFKNQKSELQSQINKFVPQIYQTTQVILKIVEFHDKIKPEIEKLKNDTINQIDKHVKPFYGTFYKGYIQQYYNHFTEYLMYFDDQFKLQKSLASLVADASQQKKLAKVEEECLQKLNDIKNANVKHYREYIMQAQQQAQSQKGNSSIICQRCIFSSLRETNKDNSIQKLTITPSQQQFLLEAEKMQGLSLTQNIAEEIQLLNFFKTSKNCDILIVKKNLSYIALLLFNNGESKKITNFENISHPCFLYVAQMETLYCFNFKDGVAKVQIDELGKCSGDQVFWDVQNNLIIEDIVYLPYNQTFIGITQKGGVVKWTETQSKFQSINVLSIDPHSSVQKEKEFKPTKQPSKQYQEIQSCPNGKFFFLSNGFIIDIYDLNYCLIQSLNWTRKIQLFNDPFDAFIVDVGQNFSGKEIHNKEIIVIKNLSDKRRITQIDEIQVEQKQEGNPILDLLKGGQVKYGPTSQFLSLNRVKTVNTYLLNTKGYEEKIREYIDIRDLAETCTFTFLEHSQCLEIINKEEQDVESVLKITYSRVPTQFCTIENNQLIPLINGFRIQLNQNQSIAVPQRAKLLTLGYIEDYLNSLEGKIFVVSIIGRQSSGKSYLLNRLFGTRFSVAASRCTDGIWASITQINGREFLVLDCEGLFSRQRTKQEETQLLAFLAGICDITILNQDLSFNRYLDELLDNLTNVIGKLKGETLFKGSLLIALRDINPKDSNGAQEQLLQSIIDTKGKNSKSSNFMTTLFNDKFLVQQFQNFEHQNFAKQIEDLRKKFLQFIDQSEHWKSGKILIEKIKILLIQLETKDDENSDLIHQRMKIDETVEKCKQSWIKSDFQQLISFQDKEYASDNYILWQDLENSGDFQKFFFNLCNQIRCEINLNQSIESHNSNCLIIQDFLDHVLKQRQQSIIQFFEKEILLIDTQMQNDIQEFIKKEKNQLKTHIEEQELLYQLCKSECSQCNLRCSKMLRHSQQVQERINTIDNSLKELKQRMQKKKSASQIDLQKKISQYQKEQQQILDLINQLQGEKALQDHLMNLHQLKQEQLNALNELEQFDFINESDIQKIQLQQFLKQYGQLEEYKLEGSDQIASLVSQENNQISEVLSLMDCQEDKIQNYVKTLILEIEKQQQKIESLKVKQLAYSEEIQSKKNEFQLQKQMNTELSSKKEEKEKSLQACKLEQQQLNIEIEVQIQKFNEAELNIENFHNQDLKEFLASDIEICEIKLENEEHLHEKIKIIKNFYLHLLKQAFQLDYCDELQKETIKKKFSVQHLKFHQFIEKIQNLSKNENDDIDDTDFYSEFSNLLNSLSEICEEIDAQNQMLKQDLNIVQNFVQLDSLKKYSLDLWNNIKNQQDTLLSLEQEENEFINSSEQAKQNLSQQLLLYEQQFDSTTDESLFQQYQDLLAKSKQISEKIRKINSVKEKLQKKRNEKIKLNNLESQALNKELEMNLFSTKQTYMQAFSEIDKMFKLMEVEQNEFQKANQELDLAEQLIETISIEQFKQQLFFKIKSKLVLHYNQEIEQIQEEILQIFQKKIKEKLKLARLIITNNILHLKNNLLEKEILLNEIDKDYESDCLKSQKYTNELELIQGKIQGKSQQLEELKQQEQQVFFDTQALEKQAQEKNAIITKIRNIKSRHNKYELHLFKYNSISEDLNNTLELIQGLKSDIQIWSSIEFIQKNIEEKELQITNAKKQFDGICLKIKDLEGQNSELTQIQQFSKELEALKDQEKHEHSCQRDSHVCDQLCIVCNDPNINCSKKAGHTQEHLCNSSNHYCTSQCEIQNCQKKCNKQYQHVGEHSCQEFHQCSISCEYCGGKCQTDFSTQHKEHICIQKECIVKCILCHKQCSKGHKHSRDQKETHFCEGIHSCTSLCTIPGICQIKYEETRKVWESVVAKFEYTYFKQVDGGKQPCTVLIQAAKQQHEDNHQCKKEAHRCGFKCPECDALCSKHYGHTDFHSAQHRNKDSQVFTLTAGQKGTIVIEDLADTKNYQVGESSSPETCSDSCSRRANSHFHLIKCEGGSKCLAKTNYIRHQHQKYQGFEGMQFDEVLCLEFWKINKWEHPINIPNKLASIQRCNFFCPFCRETKQFCQKPAWHSLSNKYEDHDFICRESHNNSEIIGYDIVFVIDATGSMGSYIEQSKQMIKKIMDKVKNTKCKDINFGIVAYRDHPPEDNSFVTKLQPLGNEQLALNFLNSLTAEGGGDYPEAVLDGLQAAADFKWLAGHDKMVFLIGDAPPHGKQYSEHSKSWAEGCPCKISEKNLFGKMSSLGIQFKILNLTSGLNKMIEVFKSHLPSLEVLDSNNLEFNFVDQVVGKVCGQIQMREITYRKI